METFLNTIDNLTVFEAVMYLLLPVLVIIIIACFASTVKWFKDLLKEEDVKPNETSARVRYSQTDEVHKQEDEPQASYRIIDDPTLIPDDTIIHIN